MTEGYEVDLHPAISEACFFENSSLLKRLKMTFGVALSNERNPPTLAAEPRLLRESL